MLVVQGGRQAAWQQPQQLVAAAGRQALLALAGLRAWLEGKTQATGRAPQGLQ